MKLNGGGWFTKLINSKFTLKQAIKFCDNTSRPNNYICYPFRCMTGYSQDSLLSFKYLVLGILSVVQCSVLVLVIYV